MKKILLFSLAILFALVSFSQSPNSFKYQTVVRNSSGNVIANQNVSFQISILQGSASSSPVYTETHYVTTNDFGLVNLNIGEGSTNDDFYLIDWSWGPYYIQIELDENGGSSYSLMGTSQLLSVPYAMYAKDVENKDDADADPYNETVYSATLNGNNLEIYDASGTTFVDLSSLDQSGMNVDDADADPNNELQTLSLSSNTLSLSDGGSVSLAQYSNLWQQNGTDIYYNNGWVGVGTDSPSGKMVVQGDAGVDPDSALFEVKNKDGQTIFAVYDGGVRIWVDDTGTKANTDKGGFAVGGYRLNKSISNEYLRISPDSVRLYFDNQTTSGTGHTGGFAIKSFNGVTKSGNTGIMYLQEDNYFIGENSGINLTSGTNNSTFGYEAGQQLTNGYNNVFIGYQAGKADSIGTNNNFIGNQAGYSNSNGTFNNFIGNTSGYSNTTGNQNNFMGDRSGYNNTTGMYNTFIGDDAGYTNTIGQANNFFGSSAGWTNDSGSYNNFIGYQTGYLNVSGSNDNFIGYQAGYNNTTGNSNNFIGYMAGYSNATGNSNNFIGYQAGISNSNGDENNFIGYQAGYNNSNGSRNNYIGYQVGYSNVDGSENNIIGYQASYNNQHGDENCIMGYQAGYSSYTGKRNVFIGYHAAYSSTGSGNYKDNIIIGDSAGLINSSYSNIFIGNNAGMNNVAYENVYIGKDCGKYGTTGQYNTYIGTEAGINATGSLNTFFGNGCGKNTSGDYNSYYGLDAGSANTTGAGNVHIGTRAGGSNETGDNNTTLGYYASIFGDLTNSMALGAGATVTANNTVIIGNSSIITIGGYAEWTNVSDKRFKTNIKDNVAGLDFILKLEPVTYNLDINKINDFNGGNTKNFKINNDKSNITYTGFLAQDVEKVAKEIGYDFSGIDTPENDNDHYGLRYATFVVPLVKAVQEQQEIIETQKTELELLKQELKSLSEKVNKLENK